MAKCRWWRLGIHSWVYTFVGGDPNEGYSQGRRCAACGQIQRSWAQHWVLLWVDWPSDLVVDGACYTGGRAETKE